MPNNVTILWSHHYFCKSRAHGQCQYIRSWTRVIWQVRTWKFHIQCSDHDKHMEQYFLHKWFELGLATMFEFQVNIFLDLRCRTHHRTCSGSGFRDLHHFSNDSTWCQLHIGKSYTPQAHWSKCILLIFLISLWNELSSKMSVNTLGRPVVVVSKADNRISSCHILNYIWFLFSFIDEGIIDKDIYWT